MDNQGVVKEQLYFNSSVYFADSFSLKQSGIPFGYKEKPENIFTRLFLFVYDILIGE